MNYFNRFNQYFNRYQALIILAVTALGLLFPDAFSWLAVYVTLMLQLIMFSMGITMTIDDFSEVLKRPKQILQIMALQFGTQPLIAFFMTRLLGLEGELALGLLLLASVPGGTASNVFTYIAGGDVPLSISATSFATLVSPIVTPALLSFYGSAYLEIEFWPMFLSIVQVVVVPVILGLLVSTFLGDRTEKIEPVLPTLSSLGILVVLVGTVSVNRDALLNTGLVLVVAVLVLNLVGYFTGYTLSKALGYNTAVARAAAIEVGQQNSGLAASLGLEHFSPTTALAGATGAVIHTLTGTLYARWCATQDEKEESTEVEMDTSTRVLEEQV